MGVPTQNPPSLGFDGVLVGKPRWDANGRAHTEPTNANTYGPHIGSMWDPYAISMGMPFWVGYVEAYVGPIWN